MHSSLRRIIKPSIFRSYQLCHCFLSHRFHWSRHTLARDLAPAAWSVWCYPTYSYHIWVLFHTFISYLGVIPHIHINLMKYLGHYLGHVWVVTQHIHINLMTYLGHKLFFRWGERWQACQHWRPALSIHRCLDLSCILHSCKYVSILYHTLYV